MLKINVIVGIQSIVSFLTTNSKDNLLSNNNKNVVVRGDLKYSMRNIVGVLR